MRRIVVIAALVVATMVAVKDGRVLASAGLVGSCPPVAGHDGAEWEACKPGRVEGAPDLSRKSCTAAGTRGDIQYWRCPTKIDAGRTG